jgi:hypothetical protein
MDDLGTRVLGRTFFRVARTDRTKELIVIAFAGHRSTTSDPRALCDAGTIVGDARQAMAPVGGW